MFGGVEVLLLTLSRLTPAHPNLRQRFAACFEGRLTETLRKNGFEPSILGAVRLSRPYTVLFARRRLKNLLKTNSFDVVICHSLWLLLLFGGVVRSAKLPLVLWLHDAPSGEHWLERLARRTRPDLIICNSQFTKATADALFEGVRTEMIHYPVEGAGTTIDAAERARLRSAHDTPDDAVVITQVSRLEPYKGHETLLRALEALKDNDKWFCWIVGGAQRPQEAAYVAQLQEIIARAGISERVRFLGQRSDVARLLAASDIKCQANVGTEPFGIVYIEAMYAGLPVVATALGGAQEIINDSCGVLTPVGDVPALSLALRRLIEDGRLRDRLGAAGRLRANELCNPDKAMRRLHSALLSLLARN